MSEYGYAGKILSIDLNNGRSHKSATADYTDRFVGGRGIAASLFRETVPPGTGAFEPGNCLIAATGPVTGFFGLAGCRWVMCGKSALHRPEAFSYGNLGGKWGSALKFAGYDALTVTGRADRPVYLFIHDGVIDTKDATTLWGLSSFDTIDSIRAELGKGVSVLAIGPAAENRVVFATALADAGASVSGGLGAVMGSKNLKAIAVVGDKRPKAARPEKVKQIADFVKKIRGGAFEGPLPGVVPGLARPEYCYGCGVGCARQSYKGEDGRRYKLFCQASGVYIMPAMDYYGKANDVPLLAVRLDDGYGLDSAVMGPMINWLIECYREGIISEEETGLPLSEAGSAEFIQTLTRKISRREGFGDVLAKGTLAAAATLGERAEALINKNIALGTSETRDYDPRLIPTTALMLATEPRRCISELHSVSGNTLITWCNWARGLEGAFYTTDDLRLTAERFWGGVNAADFSTYDGKALAAKTAQDRNYAQESLVLCDVHWPMMITSAGNPDGHVGDPTLESQLLSATTGRETSEEELYRVGERIFNLQRVIQIREGWGGREGDGVLENFFTHPLKQGDVFFNPDAVMPGPEGRIISRLGKALDRDEFEGMKNEYYRLRGWDAETGYPTKEKLQELGLGGVAGDLEEQGGLV